MACEETTPNPNCSEPQNGGGSHACNQESRKAERKRSTNSRQLRRGIHRSPTTDALRRLISRSPIDRQQYCRSGENDPGVRCARRPHNGGNAELQWKYVAAASRGVPEADSDRAV